MRVKYTKDFPPRAMKPPGKPCLISVAIIGLRNLTVPEVVEGDPILQVVVPSVKADPSKPEPGAKAKAKAKAKADGKGKEGKGKGKAVKEVGKEEAKESKEKDGEKGKEVKDKGKGDKGEAPKDRKSNIGMAGLQMAEGSDAIQTMSEVIVWSKKSETRLHDKDTNKKWSAVGRVGYEFLNVVHIAPWHLQFLSYPWLFAYFFGLRSLVLDRASPHSAFLERKCQKLVLVVLNGPLGPLALTGECPVLRLHCCQSCQSMSPICAFC